MKYSIVIVNYNSFTYVKELLNSIRALYGKDNKYFEVIIVDNSDEQTQFRDFIHNEIYIHAGENLGFGHGCNLGVSRAKGEVIIFINPDVILTGDLFSELKKYDNEFKNGNIVGLNILNGDGGFSFSYGHFPTLKGELLELFLAHKWCPQLFDKYALAKICDGNKISGDIIPVDYVCGALFGISREKFNALNGFDTKFFLYFEETEFMQRLKVLGGKTLLITKPVAIHLGGVTTGDDSDFKILNMEMGRARYFKKIYKRSEMLFIYYLVRGMRLIFLFVSKRRWIYIKSMINTYKV